MFKGVLWGVRYCSERREAAAPLRMRFAPIRLLVLTIEVIVGVTWLPKGSAYRIF
jgi:hypothetical protein